MTVTRNQKLYDVILHWYGDKIEKLQGWGNNQREAAADAMNNAGYRDGALAALDYWEAALAEEVKP